MAKFSASLLTLIIVDLLFLITGQFDMETPSSMIFNAITNLSDIQSSIFWLSVVGVLGIAGIASTSTVRSGIFTQVANVTLFVLMATTLAVLVTDYLVVYNILRNYNEVLATVIMAPIILLFIFTVGEWLRGKD